MLPSSSSAGHDLEREEARAYRTVLARGWPWPPGAKRTGPGATTPYEALIRQGRCRRIGPSSHLVVLLNSQHDMPRLVERGPRTGRVRVRVRVCVCACKVV